MKQRSKIMKHSGKSLLLIACLLAATVLPTGCGNSNQDTEETTIETASAETETAAAETEQASSETETSSEADAQSSSLTLNVTGISKYGNVKLDTTFDDMKAANMETGDIITVTSGDESWDMPVGTSFSDVDAGSMVCRFDTDDNEVALCINNGSFAEETGMADKLETEEGEEPEWTINVDSVTLTLKEKQGYADEYYIRNLERSNERSDYAELSDEEFANFRAVSVTGIKADTLYRSGSPLNDDLGRNTYVMTAIEQTGIQTILNLTDSESKMQEYDTWEGSYYSTCNILNAEMGYNYSDTEFMEKVKDCVLFINENDGPYLIHCKEGKDRTGVLCMILESYAGATYDEILDDYMKTYEYYYGVEEGTETYDKILQTCFLANMESALGVSDPETADLQDAAANYLKAAGLTDSDLSALMEKIGA